MSLFGTIQRLWMEQGAKGKDYTGLAKALQADGQTVMRRFQAASDSTRNRKAASHIIGIERWGQRRLRALLGEPLVMDEYDSYRPGQDRTMPELADDFQQTRRASLDLLQTFDARKISLEQTVVHNESGLMSAGAWFAYFNSHASRESRLVR